MGEPQSLVGPLDAAVHHLEDQVGTAWVSSGS